MSPKAPGLSPLFVILVIFTPFIDVLASFTRSLSRLLGATRLLLGMSSTRNRHKMLTSQSRETSGRVSVHSKRCVRGNSMRKSVATVKIGLQKKGWLQHFIFHMITKETSLQYTYYFVLNGYEYISSTATKMHTLLVHKKANCLLREKKRKKAKTYCFCISNLTCETSVTWTWMRLSA
jgi:hypothetical protein